MGLFEPYAGYCFGDVRLIKFKIMSDSISSRYRAELSAIGAADQRLGIKRHFNSDPDRVATFSFEVDDVYIDFSKTHLTSDVLSIYEKLAEDIDFVGKRQALFEGGKVNVSEQRSVLHTLLRNSENQGISMLDPSLMQQAANSKMQFNLQYHELEKNLAARRVPVTDIIHVGIGGSSLGTRLLFESLRPANEKRRIHFLSNVDGHQLEAVLNQCHIESTLVIGVSKTFTTAETLMNLDAIGDWFIKNGETQFKQHFLAVTANLENALSYGIEEASVVTFPEWVGGRYSVWSSVSLSAALFLGLDAFEQFLAGAATLDQHFYNAAPAQNICFIAAALDHYYVNFMHAGSRAIFAYDARLEHLVDYLQQLETESNGKDRQLTGEPTDVKTSAVIWGGVGTDVQHSVFQLLHQGTSSIPSEFILVKNAAHEFNDRHTELLANGLAQTAALLSGQTIEEVEKNQADAGLSSAAKQAKIFSGERPSLTILLDHLNPYTLGLLLAFYEHRTFCGGVLANINSFDQMGVELGKRLAKELKPRLADGLKTTGDTVFDSSTEALIKRITTD